MGRQGGQKEKAHRSRARIIGETDDEDRKTELIVHHYHTSTVRCLNMLRSGNSHLVWRQIPLKC